LMGVVLAVVVWLFVEGIGEVRCGEVR
jgi:hypothetical protein